MNRIAVAFAALTLCCVPARAQVGLTMLGVAPTLSRPGANTEPGAQLDGLDGGRVTRAAVAGNGGNPVAVVVPDGLAGPFRIHTHFVGDHDDLPDGAKTLADLVHEGWARDPTIVYIFPEGNGIGRGGRGRWNGVGDLDALKTQALAAAGLTGTPTRHLLTAHSGGGYALVRVLRAPAVAVDRIVLMDTPMSDMVAQLEARRKAGWTTPPITYIDGNQSGWLHVPPADQERLGLTPPDFGLFAEGGQSTDWKVRHYQARDAYWSAFY